MGTSRRPDRRSEPDECSMTAYQRVGVTAEVTITPTVECGPLRVTCLETRVLPGDRHDRHHRHDRELRKHERCRLVLFQELCVAVPVTFGARATCHLDQVFCGPASTDPCVCLPDDSTDSSGSSCSSGSTSTDSGSGSDSSGSAWSEGCSESTSDTSTSDTSTSDTGTDDSD